MPDAGTSAYDKYLENSNSVGLTNSFFGNNVLKSDFSIGDENTGGGVGLSYGSFNSKTVSDVAIAGSLMSEKNENHFDAKSFSDSLKIPNYNVGNSTDESNFNWGKILSKLGREIAPFSLKKL